MEPWLKSSWPTVQKANEEKGPILVLTGPEQTLGSKKSLGP